MSKPLATDARTGAVSHETHETRREAQAQLAAAHLVQLAHKAGDEGDHDTAAVAMERAASVAETAREQYDYVEETLPPMCEVLARFHETGHPQMVIKTIPHAFNNELFQQFYESAGVNPADFADSEQQPAAVPVPADIEAELNLAGPFINALVCGSPMEDGTMLYKLDYCTNAPGENGENVVTQEVMLLATSYRL